jgi:hypothetical protein
VTFLFDLDIPDAIERAAAQGEATPQARRARPYSGRDCPSSFSASAFSTGTFWSTMSHTTRSSIAS